MPVNEPIRVGYVLKRYPRYSETFIVTEILAHEKAGLEIEIFSLYPPNDNHFQDIIARVQSPVNYLPVAGAKLSIFWRALKDAGQVMPGLWAALESVQDAEARHVYQAVLIACQVRLKGIRHLHAHFASVATSVARLASRFSGVSYSFTAHAKDIFHKSVQPEDLRRKLSDAAAVITVCDYNLGYLRSNFGTAAARVQRNYNGINLEHVPYRTPLDRPPRILSVGRLVEKKGFADLVEACAILAHRKLAFLCQIIGTGPLEAELHAQIERLGLQKTVELLGPRPHGEVINIVQINIVQGASAFAAPCIVGTDGNCDGLPSVLLEAMALGTPCVSTDVAGIPEVIRDRETGLMVPQHDPTTLASAMERLLANPALRVELATRARRLIEKEFDIDRNAARLRDNFRVADRVYNQASQEVY